LVPLTAKYLQGLELEAVAADVAAIGVPAEMAEDFWHVTRGNISTLHDLAGLVGFDPKWRHPGD
jgi:glutamyl-tRNA synthetase